MYNKGKKEELKSRFLIAGIVIVIGISLIVILRMWFNYEQENSETATVDQQQEAEQGEKEKAAELEKQKVLAEKLEPLKVETDTTIKNKGNQNMWVRVKVTTQKEQAYLEESETVKNAPTYDEMMKGVWLLGDENYYYYTVALESGKQTSPLISDANERSGDFTFKAEGLPADWIERNAGSPIEAYAVYFSQ